MIQKKKFFDAKNILNSVASWLIISGLAIIIAMLGGLKSDHDEIKVHRSNIKTTRLDIIQLKDQARKWENEENFKTTEIELLKQSNTQMQKDIAEIKGMFISYIKTTKYGKYGN